MAMYQYIKTYPKPPMKRSVLISFIIMGLGMIILSWVSWPIISFNVLAVPVLSTIITPVGTTKGTLTPSNETIDYTDPNIWFPLKPQEKVEATVTTYSLSIPTLGIQNAMVEIGGNDLNKAIIHYGGTALPGTVGNAAIFGHSVLPQFFNPRSYKTIFSTLPELELGDDILLTYDQVTYRYKVTQMTVRTPEDLSMLEQPTDDAYITLVTCVPPGTYWQRLHVRAKLVRLG